jgi:hypothetical protein
MINLHRNTDVKITWTPIVRLDVPKCTHFAFFREGYLQVGTALTFCSRLVKAGSLRDTSG